MLAVAVMFVLFVTVISKPSHHHHHQMEETTGQRNTSILLCWSSKSGNSLPCESNEEESSALAACYVLKPTTGEIRAGCLRHQADLSICDTGCATVYEDKEGKEGRYCCCTKTNCNKKNS